MAADLVPGARVLLLIVLGAPILYALSRAGRMTGERFLFNGARTSRLATAASVVCGNVGIGTFVAIYLFTQSSALIGLSIVAAYSLGLLVCALLARRIHDAARTEGTFGLVDFIAARHGMANPLLIWLPVALVFLLRTAVQFIALALILSSIFPVDFPVAVGLAVFLAGAYVAIGGYEAATQTDKAQAVLICAGVLVVVWAAAASGGVAEAPRLDDLGPYSPALLAGIWLFLPLGPVLSIDNWQRIATASSPATARDGYLLALPVCLAIYAAIAFVALAGGTGGDGGDVQARLRAVVPEGYGLVVDVMLLCAIVSTIDTVVLPLAATLARRAASLLLMRGVVVAVFAVVAAVAITLGDILTGVIAAFNTLAVFLPATFAAMRLVDLRPAAAILSLNVGVATTLALSVVALELAAFGGFVVSAALYAAVHRVGRSARPGGT